MGVDARIVLPDNVRVHDVADVIGILAGKKTHKHSFSTGQFNQSQGWYTDVDGVEVKSGIAELARITISEGLSDAATATRGEQGDSPFVFYHFESEHDGRLLSPPSTTFWIAVGKALVKFFGGVIDYNDCDSKDVDCRVAKKSRSVNAPSDGKAWENFQLRKFNLKALTKKDFDAVRKYSAYEQLVSPKNSRA